MHSVDGIIQLDASDLVNHLACRHLTVLDLAVANGSLKAPASWDPALDLLRQRGLAHERNYIQHLEDSGLQVTHIEGVGIHNTTVAETVDAMKAGCEVIVQGALSNGRWSGRPDILRRVETSSKLGSWSYEVIDTKLARETKGGTILQLSLYSDLVHEVQEVLPEYMGVVAPWTDFDPQRYRTNDFSAYYRLVKASLESALANRVADDTYPEPKAHCEVCRWATQCDARRRQDDHLGLVAGISKLQIEELRDHAVDTTAELAVVSLPLPWKPKRGAAVSYERVREQARLQVESRQSKQPVYETLPSEPNIGLALLPEPSPGDVFFDFEGDPFVDPGGLEYLFGYVTVNGSGEHEYTPLWGLSHEKERENLERFVDWVMERWTAHPDMHIYHFTPYEPSAMKRLMGRHAMREDEVDQMLRAGLFVDLHRVVKGGLRAGVESYSIKELERFFGYVRQVPLNDANSALFGVLAPLQLGDPQAITDENMKVVEDYNRDDCIAIHQLREWLERIRQILVDEGIDIERLQQQDAAASDNLTEWQAMIQTLARRIAGDITVTPPTEDRECTARWILANILEWHRREDKSFWWEYFRLCDSSIEELMDDRQAISGLVFEAEVRREGNRRIHRYRFPEQDTNLRVGNRLDRDGGGTIGTLAALDPKNLTIDIKKNVRTADLHPEAVFPKENFRKDVQKHALVRIGEYVADHGILGHGPYQAARDLLLREPPRLDGTAVRHPGETALEAAKRVINKRPLGVLPIQGPPGSGKTYTAARMACELVEQRARVGITAMSHKVIIKLLDEILKAAEEAGLELQAVRKVGNNSEKEPPPQAVMLEKDNQAVFAKLRRSCQVGAGTAWLWSRPEAQNTVDVLFVDEAAQMSLADVLAVSHAAPCLVLLGDPQQLDQPTQGSHPDGTDVSALGHLLRDRQTMDEKRGLFLEETWRLHPDICAFTSEVFYEDKLCSHAGLEQQRLIVSGPLGGTGLRFIPVVHSGNQSSSDEEADRVAQLAKELTGGAKWIDQSGQEKPITQDDVLIIAPYNAQVFKIQERLPGARVGTVDKFQGQEGAVVIYSLATSTSEEAPHGMEFLYNLNRLNVATSRARCVCILVASPELFSPVCHSPRQMQLANGFCRYRELASVINAQD
ncbi:MAG: TM0106 family RecB-like putative nuclease [Caldilineaceae bacterium]|nr:TM0106 family RecB-like putative nuclease [Caldilineaceae bacterium]